MFVLTKTNLSQLIKINLNLIAVVTLLLQGFAYMLWVHQLPCSCNLQRYSLYQHNICKVICLKNKIEWCKSLWDCSYGF